jgi:hypothetical protein
MNQAGIEQKRVVVSQNASAPQLPEDLDDGTGAWPQGGDVPEADNLINTDLLDVLQYGLQSYCIRVDIGNQGDSHAGNLLLLTSAGHLPPPHRILSLTPS